jgi:hypothetical protein
MAVMTERIANAVCVCKPCPERALRAAELYASSRATMKRDECIVRSLVHGLKFADREWLVQHWVGAAGQGGDPGLRPCSRRRSCGSPPVARARAAPGAPLPPSGGSAVVGEDGHNPGAVSEGSRCRAHLSV